MQKKLKSVLKLNKIKILMFFFTTHLNYSQNTTFHFENNSFEIVKDNVVIYKDSTNFIKGICNDFQIIKSDFNNQFYLYTENECVQTKVKKLYKVNWIKNKFLIVSKEIIKINQKAIFCKKIYFDNYIVDSLIIEKLDFDDEDMVANINKKNNNEPVYYKGKLIGNRDISTDEVLYGYPIIEKYDKIENTTYYNDIALILYQNQIYDEAIFLLNKIIKKDPNNIVAYLNLADCYWNINEKIMAIENYRFYSHLMKKQKKRSAKIPKYVNDRITQVIN